PEALAKVKSIRNLGIIAHIDAGKTTTTERMLYYAGFSRRMGDVDSGDTVMDYMQQERERGITIQSASITFGWHGHQLNLIDTPGHVDFTFEVERSIRVLDGAVTIIDGVAGVQAQTETVWYQARKYNVPRLVFINKMDRVGARLDRTLEQLRTKLATQPLVCQLPVVCTGRGNDRRWLSMDQANRLGMDIQPIANGSLLAGVVDLVRMELLEFDTTKDGSVIRRTALTTPEVELVSLASPYTLIQQEAQEARSGLVEALCDLDDDLMESFLEIADPMALPLVQIQAAIRRQTLAGTVVPVLCGASYRHIGVQPLLDAVVEYLPSPLDVPRPQTVVGPEASTATAVPLSDRTTLCALAFKVLYDPRRGPMVFIRVYSGVLSVRQTLLNAQRNIKERATKLLTMYANDVEEVNTIGVGEIGVVLGLKHSRTGDTLLGITKSLSLTSSLPRLQGVEPPPPVFFRSIESHSAADEKQLNEALEHLLLEDPSLHLSTNDETGQTQLSGMGELHLDIIKDRLLRDYRVNAHVGAIRIAYRETIQTPVEQIIHYEKEVLGKYGKVGMTVCLTPLGCQEGFMGHNNDTLPSLATTDNVVDTESVSDTLHVVGTTGSNSTLPDLDLHGVCHALTEGIQQALARGPLLGFPVARVHVQVRDVQYYGIDSSLFAIRACATQAVRQALVQHETDLLEPLMDVAVQIPAEHVGTTLSDLSGTRRGRIHHLGEEVGDSLGSEHSVLLSQEGAATDTNINSPTRVIRAHVPLSAMVGYSSALRSLTAGTGTFTMQLSGYGEMTAQQKKAVLKATRGY
ncbi:Ribosome-releasing factor 2, mitochondrial, partial [Dispira simplex]